MSHSAPNGHGGPVRPSSAHSMPRRASDSSNHHQQMSLRPATAPSPVPVHVSQPRSNGNESQARQVSMELLAPLKHQLEQSWQTAVISVANHLLAAERHKDNHLLAVNADIQRLQAELQQVKVHNAALDQRVKDLSRSLTLSHESIQIIQRRADNAESSVLELESLIDRRNKSLHDAMNTLDDAANLADLVHQIATSRQQDMLTIALRLEDALMKPTLRAVYDCVRDEAFLLMKMGACGSAEIRAGKPAYPDHPLLAQSLNDPAEVHTSLMEKLPKLDEHFSQLQAGLPATHSTLQRKETQIKTEEQAKKDEPPPSGAPAGFKGLPRPAYRVRLPSAQSASKPIPTSPTRPQWLLFTPGPASPEHDVLQRALQHKNMIMMAKASLIPTQPLKLARSLPLSYHQDDPPSKRPRHVPDPQVTVHQQNQISILDTPQAGLRRVPHSAAVEDDKHEAPIESRSVQGRSAPPLRVLIPHPELPPQDLSTSTPRSTPRSASHPLTPTPPMPPASIVPDTTSTGDVDDVLVDPAYSELVGKITVEKLQGVWDDLENDGILRCRWCHLFSPDKPPDAKGQFPPNASNRDLNDHMIKEHGAVWTTGLRRTVLDHLSSGADVDTIQDEGQQVSQDERMQEDI